MLAGIRAGGGSVERVYYCLHHPQARLAQYRKRCNCRKPKIGLLQQAARDLGVSLKECYMVGDGIPDILAGLQAGCRTIFVGRWKCELCQFTESPDARPALVAKDLFAASQLVKAEIESGRFVASAHSVCAKN
jgi:D-glycero-D-manno-heptose 1,7-bisphosphate phosphatase